MKPCENFRLQQEIVKYTVKYQQVIYDIRIILTKRKNTVIT